jgi:hypothetical protein
MGKSDKPKETMHFLCRKTAIPLEKYCNTLRETLQNLKRNTAIP